MIVVSTFLFRLALRPIRDASRSRSAATTSDRRNGRPPTGWSVVVAYPAL